MGEVRAVHNFGAGDLLEVAPPGAASFFIPFTRAAVPEVRIAEGLILIDPPGELEDEDPTPKP